MLVHPLQISLPSYLKALCLVSHAWNYVATERLYTRIDLDIRDLDGQLQLFHACLQHGAWRHLRFVRSLGLYEVIDHRVTFGIDTEAAGDFEADAIRKRKAILHVLEQILENRLLTFRWARSVCTSAH